MQCCAHELFDLRDIGVAVPPFIDAKAQVGFLHYMQLSWPKVPQMLALNLQRTSSCLEACPPKSTYKGYDRYQFGEATSGERLTAALSAGKHTVLRGRPAAAISRTNQLRATTCIGRFVGKGFWERLCRPRSSACSTSRSRSVWEHHERRAAGCSNL